MKIMWEEWDEYAEQAMGIAVLVVAIMLFIETGSCFDSFCGTMLVIYLLLYGLTEKK